MRTAEAFLLAAIALAWSAGAAHARPGDHEAGRLIFKQQCAACHGKGGKGDGPAAVALNPKPADLSDPARLGTRTDEELIAVVSKGGAVRGLSPVMPAFEGSLSPDQIRQVVAYVRALAATPTTGTTMKESGP